MFMRNSARASLTDARRVKPSCPPKARVDLSFQTPMCHVDLELAAPADGGALSSRGTRR